MHSFARLMNPFARILFIAILVFTGFHLGFFAFFGLEFHDNSLLYLYSLLIIIGAPVIARLMRKNIFTAYLRHHYRSGILLAVMLIGLTIGVGVVAAKNLPPWALISWMYGLFSIGYVFESRLAALVGIALLGYALIFYLIRQPESAHAVAIYAYAFLGIMAATQLREYRLKKEQPNE